MHVLLDENMDRRLKRSFDAQHVVRTVAEMGWSGVKNGELLRLAAVEFEAFVTMDQGIRHQQNLTSLDLGIVIISALSNRRQSVEPAMPEVNRVLKQLQPGQVVHVAVP